MAAHKAQRVVYDGRPECSVCGAAVVGEGWSLRHVGEPEPTPPPPGEVDYAYRDAAIATVRERMKHGGDPAVAAVDALLLGGFLRAKPLKPLGAIGTPVGKDHPATSHAAAAKAAPRAGTLKAAVLDLIRRAGPNGHTADEVQTLLRREHQSISPAMNGLAREGYIMPVKVLDGAVVTRPTRLGNQAEVYVLTPQAVAADMAGDSRLS